MDASAFQEYLGEDEYKGAEQAISVDLIDTPKEYRYRALDKDNLGVLVQNMRMEGQHSPIQVEPAAEGRFNLIAGRHRLEALRQLNRENAKDGDNRFGLIRAFVYDDALPKETRLQAMLRENTTRKNLDPESLYTMYKSWRTKHPPLRSAKGEKGQGKKQDPNARTDAQAASFFGVSVHTIDLWNERVRGEADPAKAEALKARKTRENAKRAEISKQVRSAAKGKTSTYQPATPDEAVRVGNVGNLDELEDAITKAPEHEQPVTPQTNILSAVRSLMAVALLPEFHEVASAEFAMVPAKKLQAVHEAMRAGHALAAKPKGENEDADEEIVAAVAAA